MSTKPIIPMDDDLNKLRDNIRILYDSQIEKDEKIKNLENRIYKLENP